MKQNYIHGLKNPDNTMETGHKLKVEEVALRLFAEMVAAGPGEGHSSHEQWADDCIQISFDLAKRFVKECYAQRGR